MSQNSSKEDNLATTASRESKRPSFLRTPAVILAYIVWLAVAFIASQLIVVLIFALLNNSGIIDAGALDETVLQVMLSAGAYILALVLVVTLPKIVKDTTSLAEIGVNRWPKFSDIGLGLVGYLPYILISYALVVGVSLLYGGFDQTQAQEVGFDNLSSQVQYIMAFIALVILAPVAEELMFRGYLYSKLKAHASTVIAILLTSLAFAVLHMQLNVGVDVFALSIVLCLLRETTGSIWAGIVLHMLKNGIAYYFLFVNPMLIQ